jgi:hypothetical protein
MKKYWTTYACATAVHLVFWYVAIEEFRLCALFTVGVVASTVSLIFMRDRLARRSRPILVALLASLSTIGAGFIAFLVLGWLWGRFFAV